MLPVAVDAMGGDKAPGEIVAGALRAAEELGIEVALVGPRTSTRRDCAIAASEVIEMGEDPAGGAPEEGRHARSGRGGGARRQLRRRWCRPATPGR